ncbi:MAG TPA: hypothetical protein DCO77_00240 [Nitrospiraceae bacterium]|nr:hypothetical protein [Nitrospiraceae bacterium]
MKFLSKWQENSPEAGKVLDRINKISRIFEKLFMGFYPVNPVKKRVKTCLFGLCQRGDHIE